MGEILNTKQAIKISNKLRGNAKSIVLAGGVFDILHIGHTRFLEKAKKEGDFLFLLLESDESVKKLKGEKRPVNNQKERAEVLSALSSVDYIINLKGTPKNEDYDKIVGFINPNIIAATFGDSYIFHKKRQAKLVGAKLKLVGRIKGKSTSDIINSVK